ncbi:unnamed protein product [Closterium sp. Naga37s-1]|nr:unnamed protein product [Closterium sp. Naga37s-1]
MARSLREPVTARRQHTTLLVASLVLIGMICGPATTAAMTLEEAINQANELEADAATTELVLTSDVELTALLPALSGAAKLTITGACGSTGTSRCIISGGGGAFPIFASSSSSGSTAGQLTLVNLSFQQAKSVFSRVLAPINASQCEFAHNNRGGVLSDKFPLMDAPPKRLFTGCVFFNNSSPMGGGAVNIDATTFDAFGLIDRVPALSFLRCTFNGNSALTHVGGAVRVAGTARLRFESCLFSDNSADASGGAVYSKDAALTFVKTNLYSNKARGTAAVSVVTSGAGGAVYAAASGTNTEAAVRFCSTTAFQYNSARLVDGANLYLEAGVVGSRWAAALAFCGCSKPIGSVVPTSGWQLLTSCSASQYLVWQSSWCPHSSSPSCFPAHSFCRLDCPHVLPPHPPAFASCLFPFGSLPPFSPYKQHL